MEPPTARADLPPEYAIEFKPEYVLRLRKQAENPDLSAAQRKVRRWQGGRLAAQGWILL